MNSNPSEKITNCPSCGSNVLIECQSCIVDIPPGWHFLCAVCMKDWHLCAQKTIRGISLKIETTDLISHPQSGKPLLYCEKCNLSCLYYARNKASNKGSIDKFIVSDSNLHTNK